MRQKLEAITCAADQDAHRRQVIEQCMLIVADPDTVRQQAASPRAAQEEAPAETPVAAPHRNQVIAEDGLVK